MKPNKPSSARIVLTDDDDDDRSFFREAFSELDMQGELRTFCDGKELMDYLNSEEATPDVVILDLNMPRKSGFECIEEIRSNSRFSHTSIAVYSTSSLDSDIDATFKSGANLYIKKPNDYNMLKKMISTVMHTDWSLRFKGLNRDTFMLHL
ncbi:response regulator [Flavobacterium sp. MAH-1]|uniref:Response regulator n=1 Tax=Flavobacterium agri TaxID=2743471 RepID=A0A7Y8Y0Z4_9FLAO|nr:response regulator [Flavobacterium agri]NUY79296.1 response regulator [Flavobacterium agri]NYA69320.1 response regulator [Flavobacterium agri]